MIVLVVAEKITWERADDTSEAQNVTAGRGIFSILALSEGCVEILRKTSLLSEGFI